MTLTHFMSYGQVCNLAPYFPSHESWLMAKRFTFTDITLHEMKQEQAQRILERRVKRDYPQGDPRDQRP